MAIKSRTKEKPTAAFVLILLGGLLILIAGLVSVVGGLFAIEASQSFLVAGVLQLSSILIASGAFGAVCGFVVVVSAVLMHDENTKKRTNWSVVALIFGILSLVNLGGFLVGFVLTLVGGVFGIVHE